MAKRGRKPRLEWTDARLYDVCKRIVNGDRVTDIANITGLKRQGVYKALSEGVKRGMIKLEPLPEIELSKRIGDKLNFSASVRVLSCASGNRSESWDPVPELAAAAAHRVVRLIRQLWSERKHQESINRKRICIGLGSGRSVALVSKSLGSILKREKDLDLLGAMEFRALTAVADPEYPWESAMAQFSYYLDERAATPLKFKGLFAPAFVPVDDLERQKKLAFPKGIPDMEELDIVITSIATSDDDHAPLRNNLDERTKSALNVAGWVGDVQYRAYSNEGPILEKNLPMQQSGSSTLLRAFTLIEISDLVKMRLNGRHIILLAGPCGHCQKTKSDALLPLLTVPELRVFTHLILDNRTAQELVDKL